MFSTEEEKTRLQTSLHQLQGQHKNLQLELKKRDLVIDYMETALGEAMANFMQLQVSLQVLQYKSCTDVDQGRDDMVHRRRARRSRTVRVRRR